MIVIEGAKVESFQYKSMGIKAEGRDLYVFHFIGLYANLFYQNFTSLHKGKSAGSA